MALENHKVVSPEVMWQQSTKNVCSLNAVSPVIGLRQYILNSCIIIQSFFFMEDTWEINIIFFQ